MDELDKLNKIAESQKREKAKLEGKLETLFEELGEEGFTSVKGAKGDMELISKKINKMKKTFLTNLEKFKKENADQISKAS